VPAEQVPAAVAGEAAGEVPAGEVPVVVA